MSRYLSDCGNARTGEGRQGIEMLGGGGFKRPRPRLGSSAVGERSQTMISGFLSFALRF